MSSSLNIYLIKNTNLSDFKTVWEELPSHWRDILRRTTDPDDRRSFLISCYLISRLFKMLGIDYDIVFEDKSAMRTALQATYINSDIYKENSNYALMTNNVLNELLNSDDSNILDIFDMLFKHKYCPVKADWFIDLKNCVYSLLHDKELRGDITPDQAAGIKNKKLLFKIVEKNNLDESFNDYSFLVKCNDEPEEIVNVVAENEDKAREYVKNMYARNHVTYANDSFNNWIIINRNKNIIGDVNIEEAYSDEELDDLTGRTFNLQKIENIYRRKKYDTPQLFAHTRCIKCGREKRVFLSNLINDPEKYGSCICSDTNLDSKIDNIEKLYSNKKKLKTNTSGYNGVSFVKTYAGQPYNKWRAYIEVDGVRTYLGDFDIKKDAVKARKEAGEKGIKWYKENRNKLVKNIRRRTKKYKTSKYRDTLEKTKTTRVDNKD